MHSRLVPLLLALSIFLLIVSAGCGNTNSPVTPSSDLTSVRTTSVSGSNHSLLGMWQFYIDPVNETLDFVPLRTCDIHMNGIAFMEPPAGETLAVDQIVDFQSDEITVDLKITHPVAGAKFATAFDVCGILIGRGSSYFPTSMTLYWAGDEEIRLLNADGYTRWWNPHEFPENTSKPHQGYIDGMLGTKHIEAEFDATLNGYKYFATSLTDPEATMADLDPASRGVFEAGTSCTRRYQIYFPPSGLVFNYAVDASWAPADVSPPVNIPEDFPMSANRPEAYRYEIQNMENTLIYHSGTGYGDGYLNLSVYIYDWFEPEDNRVCVYAQDDILMGYCNPMPSDYGDDWAVFDFSYIVPMMMDSSDDVMLWIGVECGTADYQGALPFELQGMYWQEYVTVDED